jgi:hypothetical protein
MEIAGSFDVLQSIIEACRQAMAVTAEIGRELAAVFWSMAVLFTLSVMIAGGASGTMAYIIRAIIWGGIVIGGLMLWPTVVVDELWASVHEISMWISGRELNPVATAERGWDLFLRAYDAGVTWQMVLPWNWPAASAILGAGLGVAVIFLGLALLLAIAIIQFFIGAAIAPLMIPFVLAGPLAGFGYTLVGFMLSSLVYLATMSVIITVGESVFIDATLPGPDEILMIGDLGKVAAASLVVFFLAWKASSWAAQITRGASGGTGLTGIIGTFAGMAMGRGAGAATGSARAGQATVGSAPSPAGVTGGARSAAGSGVVGRISRP